MLATTFSIVYALFLASSVAQNSTVAQNNTEEIKELLSPEGANSSVNGSLIGDENKIGRGVIGGVGIFLIVAAVAVVLLAICVIAVYGVRDRRARRRGKYGVVATQPSHDEKRMNAPQPYHWDRPPGQDGDQPAGRAADMDNHPRNIPMIQLERTDLQLPSPSHTMTLQDPESNAPSASTASSCRNRSIAPAPMADPEIMTTADRYDNPSATAKMNTGVVSSGTIAGSSTASNPSEQSIMSAHSIESYATIPTKVYTPASSATTTSSPRAM